MIIYHAPFNPTQLNKWIIINVSQTKVGEDYQYIVEMNGEVLHTVKNAKPWQFENVKIYISDPWTPAVPGYVRNVYIKGKVKLITFGTLCDFVFAYQITKKYKPKLHPECDENLLAKTIESGRTMK